MYSFNVRLIPLLNAAVTSSGANSSELDVQPYTTGNAFLLVNARSGGTNVVTIAVTHSDTSGGVFTAVPASAIFDVDTGAAFSFATVSTTASTQRCGLNTQQLKRFVRVELTGTTLSGHNFAIVAGVQPQYTENF
jgi:hypothetical protein